MGVTGSGKSTFIKEIDSTTKHAKIYPTKINGREVLLVDTPGFNDSRFNDTEILMEITTELARIYENKVRTSGVIFMHDVSGEKLSGKDRQYLSMFKRIVGEKALRNVTLLTTKWDRTRFDPTYRERKEWGLRDGPWKDMIVAGATVQRVDPTAGHDAYVNIVINVLRNVAITLQIQRELVDEKLNLNETGAGKILDEQIRQATEALRRDLNDVNQRLKDEQNKHGKRIQDLEEEKVDLRRDLDQMKQNREALEQQFEGLKISEETRVKNMQKMIDDLRREQQEQQRREENERQEQQRLEQQRLDQQREQQRLEWQLYEQQRLEQQRLEQQRLEQQRLEQQRQQQQGECTRTGLGTLGATADPSS
ncbi:hypothetical protein B0H14DRAFT_2773249 [Mycena olivaceomarginata]|nr:hypothetical protein B0H14DRAFT_2773249 [Mycena olivaceomarginata]